MIELDLAEAVAMDEVIGRLNEVSFSGLAFHSAIPVHAGRKKTTHVASVFEMTIPVALAKVTAQKLASFLAESSVMLIKLNGKSVDVRAAVNRLTLDGNCLYMELTTTAGADAGFREVLETLGLREQLFRTIFPIRKKVLLSYQ